VSATITVAVSPFPNVPNLPGVPQLARSPLFPTSSPPTIATPTTLPILAQAASTPAVWGVFDSENNLAINADSVMGFDWRVERRVSNFPIQNGAFASYNKVALPYESSVSLAKGGSEAERNAFLAQIDAVVDSLGLYTIRTPEKSYTSCNCTRAELSRKGTANATYFDVELFFVQIIQVNAQYSSTSAVQVSTENASVPSAIPTVNNGVTSTTVPTSAVQTQVTQAITPPTPTG